MQLDFNKHVNNRAVQDLLLGNPTGAGFVKQIRQNFKSGPILAGAGYQPDL